MNILNSLSVMALGLRAIASAFFVFSSLLAQAQEKPFAGSGEVSSVFDFVPYVPTIADDYTLPNGMRVVLIPMAEATTVSTNLVYNVGGLHDPIGSEGFAHLFEHLMFNATETIPSIAAFWGEFLQFNASTHAGFTDYWVSTIPEDLPKVLWLERSRMTSLIVDEAKLEKEKSVVSQELNQNFNNNPQNNHLLESVAAPLTHNRALKRPVAGSIESVSRSGLHDVRAFHKTYYKPNNAVLVIAGALNVETTRKLVAAYFANIEGGPIPMDPRAGAPLGPPPAIALEPQSQCRLARQRTIYNPQVSMPIVSFSGLTPARENFTENNALGLGIAYLLADGGPAEKELIETARAVKFDVVIDLIGLPTFSLMGMGSPEEIQAWLYDKIRDISQKGIPEDRLISLKNKRLLGAVEALQDPVETARFAQKMIRFSGTPQAMQADLLSLSQLTNEHIKRAFRKYLCEQPITILKTLPQAAAKEAPAIVDIAPYVSTTAKAPPLLPEYPIRQKAFREDTLANGLKLYFIQDKRLPKTALTLVFNDGSAFETRERKGGLSLLLKLMRLSNEKYSQDELTTKLGALNASILTLDTDEQTRISITGLSRDKDNLLDLFRTFVFDAKVTDEAALARVQRLALGALESSISPDTAAQRQLGNSAYRTADGKHPYCCSLTRQSIENITPDYLSKRYDNLLKRARALIIVSNLDFDSFSGDFLSAFSTLSLAPAPALGKPKALKDSHITIIDRPNSNSTTMHMQYEIPLSADVKDHIAQEIFSLIFSSKPTARLGQNLRIKHGYTYGIDDQKLLKKHSHAYVLVSALNPKATVASLQEIDNEISRLDSDPISDAEFLASTKIIRSQILQGAARVQTVSQGLANALTQGIPYTSLGEKLTALGALNRGYVIRIGKNILSRPRVIVLVGDAALIEQQLEASAYAHVSRSVIPFEKAFE